MSISVTVDPVTRLAVGVAKGELDLADMKQGAVEFWALAGQAPSAILWDFREARFSLSSEEVAHLARYTKTHNPIIDCSRMAFVVSGELEFGLVRMFEAFRQEPGLEIRVFRDFAAAHSWVAKPLPSRDEEDIEPTASA